jgi:transcriptional regulator with XRE-family HTH domain
MTSTPVTEWLHTKFMAFEKEKGKRQTVTAFAEYCGIRQVDMSRYMNGSRPVEGENLRKIAAVLGEELYDLVGKPRSDPRLKAIIEHWGEASDEAKDNALAALQRFVETGRSESDHKRVASTQRK